MRLPREPLLREVEGVVLSDQREEAALVQPVVEQHLLLVRRGRVELPPTYGVPHGEGEGDLGGVDPGPGDAHAALHERPEHREEPLVGAVDRARVATVVGDVREVIADLIVALQTEQDAGNTGDFEGWVKFLAGVKAKYPLGYDAPPAGALAPQYVIERLGQISGPESIYVAGVGQHQMWATHFVQYENPNTWINSGGLGTMGFSVPAAMGAKVAQPDTTVWAIDGDGCFQMTNQELATCTIEGIPIKVAIINNESLGMVRQWQTLFYNERYSNTDLHTGPQGQVPDFVKLADAYGAVGLRCDSPGDVDDTINKAMEIDDVPVVVDFRVHRDAMVWPMVAAGTSNDAILYARGLAPQFEEDEL